MGRQKWGRELACAPASLPVQFHAGWGSHEPEYPSQPRRREQNKYRTHGRYLPVVVVHRNGRIGPDTATEFLKIGFARRHVGVGMLTACRDTRGWATQGEGASLGC